MDWLTGGLMAAGMGSSLLGGLMGSQGSGDTQREAARRSTEITKNQSMLTSQLMAPYIGAGNLAVRDLWGYNPVSSAGTGTTGTGATGMTVGADGTTTVPILTSKKNKWDAPTSLGGQTYAKTGEAFDRTGGAGDYKGRLDDLLTNFKFNTDDPAYKYKKEESTKSIDKALASRGLFDSRAGVNMLTDADRAITAEEYDKQYNRQYGGLTDLFNMSSKLGETGYQSLLDAVKVGSGSGASAGSMGNQATGNTVSAYGQMAQAGSQNDANNASLYSGLGAMPMNAMLLYNLLGKS